MYLVDSQGVARNYRDALTPQNIPNPEFPGASGEYNNADSALGEAYRLVERTLNLTPPAPLVTLRG